MEKIFQNRVVVLLSGGVDSKAVLHFATTRHDIQNIIALTYRFVNVGESLNETHVHAAIAHVKEYNIQKHIIVNFPIENHSGEVPFRNQILFSYACYIAKMNQANTVYAGIKKIGQKKDFIGFYDCSLKFYELLSALCWRQGVTLEVPFIDKMTRDVTEYILQNNISIENCMSCDEGKHEHCGTCGKCKEVLYEANRFGLKTRIKGDVSQYFRLEEFRLYTNNLCDKNCPMCFYDKFEGMPKIMTAHLLEIIAKKAHDWDIRGIMLSGREPIYTASHFNNVIGSLRKWYEYEIYVNTNSANIVRCAYALYQISRIYYSLNTAPIPEHVMDFLQDYSKKTVIYFVPSKRVDNEYIEKIKLVNLLERGLKRVYLRKDIYSNEYTYDDWLDWLLSWGFEVEAPRTHHACERYIRELTIMTNGDIVGCAKDTYIGEMPKNLLNIKKSTLEDIRNKAENAGTQCTHMLELIKHEDIFRRWRE